MLVSFPVNPSPSLAHSLTSCSYKLKTKPLNCNAVMIILKRTSPSRIMVSFRTG